MRDARNGSAALTGASETLLTNRFVGRFTSGFSHAVMRSVSRLPIAMHGVSIHLKLIAAMGSVAAIVVTITIETRTDGEFIASTSRQIAKIIGR